MPYAKVITPMREALIALEPSNWGTSYRNLFDQTDVSGWEEWLAYSYNNFNNPFQQADEERYNVRRPWAVIFRDKIREGGKEVDAKGRLNVDYVSHAGTKWEKTHSGIWAPQNGYWVPTADGIFVPGTSIPFETVQDMKEAIRRLEAKGIPPEQVSYFWKPERYDGGEFVGRGFGPRWGGGRGGRFFVGAGGHYLSSNGWVASRLAYDPAHGKPEIVMKVVAPQKK